MSKNDLISAALENLTQFEESVGPLAVVICSYWLYPKINPFIREGVKVEANAYFKDEVMLMGDSVYWDALKSPKLSNYQVPSSWGI